jgi:hypothetical protein
MADSPEAAPGTEPTQIERMLREQGRALQRIAQYLGEQEARRIVAAIEDPQRLEHWGRKVYSQGDEDGILCEILRRIGLGPADGMAIEFGVESGLQSNTHWLLRQGHRVLWLEFSDQHVKWIRRWFADYLAKGQLTLAHELVAVETIDSRLSALANGQPVLVLSIDVDGNDYWLWERVQSIHPAVVIVEYNATFPPPAAIVQEHAAEFRKAKSDYWGASLGALWKLGQRKGYTLVGCTITGVNAFFVRNDLATARRFPGDHTPETLYHPLRRHLIADAFAPPFPPDVGRYVEV